MSTAQVEFLENGAAYGEVFTKRWVVETLLDLTGYTADLDLGGLRLLEPSCGSGAFLAPIVERLIQSAVTFNRPLESLHDAIRAYDLQHKQVIVSRELCSSLLVSAGVERENAEEISRTWVNQADFLLGDLDPRKADVAVGNPPYIRYDDLDEITVAEYRARWKTMKGRGDIYVGFFERCLSLLAPDGKLGFICADRWMRNSYGAPLRELIAARYSVEHVWTMHDVDAFMTQVSAYPAITVISNKPQGRVLVADTTAEFNADSARALTKANRLNVDEYEGRGVKAHRLHHWFQGTEFWPTGSPARLALIELLSDRFGTLHDSSTGTYVSIGIATGADKTFITKNSGAVESERLLPLAMRRDLMTGQFQWQGNYLINPWSDDGSLIDLEAYPRMESYLRDNPSLKQRFIARKNPESWFRTIDRVKTSIIDKPKLLIQDMKTTIHPVLEPGGYYPHHNLYYVTSETWDMEVLGGLLLSRISQAFIEAYGVRMRGGTLRFQAQYLRMIRVPRPEHIFDSIQNELREAFRERDVDAATDAAGRAFGINPAEFELS